MKILDISFKDLPALKISSSFTLNEKLAFARNKKADIVTIGSSVSLDNLYSDDITSYFKSTSYLNMSSFGFTNKDIYGLLSLYTTIHKPKVLLINSSIGDYKFNDKLFDCADVRKYLTTTGYNETFLKYINLFYILSEAPGRKQNIDKKNDNQNQYINYDNYGGIQMRKDTNGLKKENPVAMAAGLDIFFNLNLVDKKIYEHNFKYLDSISIFCRKNNIELYFFQTPIRGVISKNFSNGFRNKLAEHIDRERKIILSQGHHFVNGFDRIWDDSLFNDQQHMNSVGANIYTKYCLHNCK